LTARLSARWNVEQVPDRLRLNILPCAVHIFFRLTTSLKSTNAGRGQPSFVQKRQRFFLLRPSFFVIMRQSTSRIDPARKVLKFFGSDKVRPSPYAGNPATCENMHLVNCFRLASCIMVGRSLRNRLDMRFDQ